MPTVPRARIAGEPDRTPARLPASFLRARAARKEAPLTPTLVPKRLVAVEEEVSNLVGAIASGALRMSPAMAVTLADDESAGVTAR